jgi:hypothetical protein
MNAILDEIVLQANMANMLVQSWESMKFITIHYLR